MTLRANADSDEGRRGGSGFSCIPNAMMVSQGCRRIRVWRWGGKWAVGAYLTRVEGRNGRLRQVRLSRTEAARGGQTGAKQMGHGGWIEFGRLEDGSQGDY